jgi:hypothetical protein
MGHHQLLKRGRGDVLVKARVLLFATDRPELFQNGQNEASRIDAATSMEWMK